MRSYCLYPLIISICCGWATLQSSEEEERLTRRIQAHLVVRDYAMAVEEAQQALILYPQCATLHEGYIRSLAKVGNEKKLLQAWDNYAERFPDKNLNRELIEEIAWGVLQKASQSHSLIMRDMSLLAAFFSQDAKGVAILNQGMRDSNYAVRTVAVKLAGRLRDHKLIEEVKRLFREEKVWSVRQQVLEAIGKMKIDELKPDLEALIASNESLAAEKALAIASLLELMDSINRVEIERLAASNRAGLRQLACQAIAYFQSLRDVDQLLRLAKDPHPDVRLESFQALGKIRPSGDQVEEVLNLARQSVQDSNYQVALSAAWLLTLYMPDEGQKAIGRFLDDGRREVRILAAAALGATGHYGMTLALDQFRVHADPFVRLNLALGLIGQRQATQEVANYLSHILMTEKETWSTLEVGLFRAIINKPAKKDDVLTTAETESQLLRLELLNLLAILKAPNTQETIRQYLNERSWEISATAAIVLLMEGDDLAVDSVRQLLQDSQSRVRLQAALILSLWSREESAIQNLEEGFATSDWELKSRILEGIGRIGSMRSVPFLLNVLKESSQTLRLIAAMALIQCLNH